MVLANDYAGRTIKNRLDGDFDKSQFTILRMEDGKENHEVCNHNIWCPVRDSNRVPNNYDSNAFIGLTTHYRMTVNRRSSNGNSTQILFQENVTITTVAGIPKGKHLINYNA